MSNSTVSYASIRDRLVTLGRSLTPEQSEMICACTPEWTITQIYAHLCGSNDDILGGRLDGVATDPWTQAQVDKRANNSLTEILDEWESYASLIDAVVAQLGDEMDPRFFIDAWTHEQDIRSTLRMAGGTDDPTIEAYAPMMARGLCVSVEAAGLESLAVILGDQRVETTAPSHVVLRVPPYEFMRGRLGRRSRAQVARWDWSIEDPSDYVDMMFVFGYSPIDLHDAL